MFALSLSIGLFLLASSYKNEVSGDVIHVQTAHDLNNALGHVKPGDTIQLADGEFHGVFIVNVSASAQHPIVLIGTRKSLISSTSYGLHLNSVSYWTLKGFTIHNSKKGLILDHSHHNTIDDIEVHHIDEEGIHIRNASSDNILQHSYIHNTGLKEPGFGEGVYLGSAVCIFVFVLTLIDYFTFYFYFLGTQLGKPKARPF